MHVYSIHAQHTHSHVYVIVCVCLIMSFISCFLLIYKLLTVYDFARSVKGSNNWVKLPAMRTNTCCTDHCPIQRRQWAATISWATSKQKAARLTVAAFPHQPMLCNPSAENAANKSVSRSLVRMLRGLALRSSSCLNHSLCCSLLLFRAASLLP